MLSGRHDRFGGGGCGGCNSGSGGRGGVTQGLITVPILWRLASARSFLGYHSPHEAGRVGGILRPSSGCGGCVGGGIRFNGGGGGGGGGDLNFGGGGGGGCIKIADEELVLL